MATDSAPDQQYDTPKSIGTAPDRVWKRWMMEIESISKNERDWRALGRQVLDRYHGYFAYDKKTMKAADSYNILFSNTDTKRQVLYNTTPQPDVKRRWRDAGSGGPGGIGGAAAVDQVLCRQFRFRRNRQQSHSLDMLLTGGAGTIRRGALRADDRCGRRAEGRRC